MGVGASPARGAGERSHSSGIGSGSILDTVGWGGGGGGGGCGAARGGAAPARKPGGAGRVRKKSPAEGGHKVIGSSSSTNCGPASQPLLSGRSETRAQNCRQARSKNVEPRGWFRQARGPRQKKPRQEARLFRPPPGLPTLRTRKAPVGSPTPSTARLAVGCCVGTPTRRRKSPAEAGLS